MSSHSRAVSRAGWLAAPLFAVAMVACGDKPSVADAGPEICDNHVDDNGNKLVDCADPQCFHDSHCTTDLSVCLTDCTNAICEGQSCGDNCVCMGGHPERVDDGGTGGGSAGGGSAGGGSAGGGAAGGGSGGGSGGGATGGGSGGGATGGGSAGGGGGGSAGGGSGGGSAGGGSGGGSAGGGSGGGSAGGGTGGGSASCTGCGTGCACVAGVKHETICSDNIDNDADNATDCDDSDCVGITCGMGCTCALGHKTETNCSDGVDNNGNGLTDCADPDCVGAGTEICNDGVDNTCDRAIDCADPKCTGNLQCANLGDGRPCSADSQCAGGKCNSEAATGYPNGACTNLASCTVATGAGCNGGRCVQGTSFNTCRPPCTGTGISGTGACRPGFACLDPDATPSNNNNFCVALCTSDSECAGSGSGYGCNPWSKLCQQKDQGLARYGAACTLGSQCESGFCYTGTTFPGGYCTGPCRGDTLNCGPNGWCAFDPTYGDNVAFCWENCTASTQCRNADNYRCWFTDATHTSSVCACMAANQGCTANNQCCSGSCDLNFYLCN